MRAREGLVRRGSGVFLSAGMALILLYFLLPDVAQALLYVSLHLAALVALSIALRRYKPKAIWSWRLVLAGWALYAAANVIWYPYQLATGVTFPYPSIIDVLFIPAYVLLLFGLAGLIRNRSAGRDPGSVVDAAIVGIGTGVLAWEFLIAPYLADPRLGLSAKLASVAYPSLDAMIVALLALFIFTPGSRPRAFWLMSIGLVGQLLADLGYAFNVLAGTFEFGDPYFAGYLVFFVTFGAAVLDPSMRELSEPQIGREPQLSRWRLAFLAVAALLPLVVIGLHDALAAEMLGVGERIGYLAAAGLMFILVLLRMAQLLVDIAEYRRLERLKDEFVSVVSHELRTPLTSIRGALGLVAGGAMGELPSGAKRMVDIAAQNADRLVRLVNDILDIERIESGKVAMGMERSSVSELLQRAVREMKPMADEANVDLSFQGDDAVVVADPDRIVQTATNLLSNAIKFSPAGGSVRVRSESSEREIRIAVSDEGRGIPADHQARIFERFQQVDASDAREKGGTGLGLAICKSIVERHGGRIWIESEVGRGTTFFVSLPAVEDEVPGTRRSSGPRVLVCDDDPSVLEVVCTMLEKKGYAAIPTSNGRDAVEKAVTEKPDVVLLDLLMPGMSGWDTVAALQARDQTKDLPVVILSVLTRGEGRLTESEVAGWVSKPIEGEVLFTSLQEALAARPRGTSLLLVEDDEDLAEVLVQALRSGGIITHHAQTARGAIDLAIDVSPDLIVLDLMLPDGDGGLVVDNLRRNDRLRTTPLVVYTAKDLDSVDRERLRLGETEFMTKGRVGVEEFHERVISILDRVMASSTVSSA